MQTVWDSIAALPSDQLQEYNRITVKMVSSLPESEVEEMLSLEARLTGEAMTAAEMKQARQRHSELFRQGFNGLNDEDRDRFAALYQQAIEGYLSAIPR